MNLLHNSGIPTFLTLPVCAQQPLSLQECIDLAMGRNLQHQRNEQTLAASRASLYQRRPLSDLTADANFTAPTFTGGAR